MVPFSFFHIVVFIGEWGGESALENETKSLTQQKRSSDKVGDKVGDMDKIACQTEKIFW